jgi:hypothetical protein
MLPNLTALLLNIMSQGPLHLMVPQRFFTHGQRSTGDRHVYARRTRFIPNAMLAHFDTCFWPPATSDGGADDRHTRDPVDPRDAPYVGIVDRRFIPRRHLRRRSGHTSNMDRAACGSHVARVVRLRVRYERDRSERLGCRQVLIRLRQ